MNSQKVLDKIVCRLKSRNGEICSGCGQELIVSSEKNGFSTSGIHSLGDCSQIIFLNPSFQMVNLMPFSGPQKIPTHAE